GGCRGGEGRGRPARRRACSTRRVQLARPNLGRRSVRAHSGWHRGTLRLNPRADKSARQAEGDRAERARITQSPRLARPETRRRPLGVAAGPPAPDPPSANRPGLAPPKPRPPPPARPSIPP